MNNEMVSSNLRVPQNNASWMGNTLLTMLSSLPPLLCVFETEQQLTLAHLPKRPCVDVLTRSILTRLRSGQLSSLRVPGWPLTKKTC